MMNMLAATMEESAMRINFVTTLAVMAVAVASGPTPAEAADVTLIRGSFAETVSVGPGGPPTLLRGARPRPEAVVAAPPPRGERVAPARVIAAGRTLWIADRARGTLRACWPRGTGMVGEYRIYCTDGY